MVSFSFIDAHLSSMNYDARKLPLGKLAKSTILNGFAALKVCNPTLFICRLLLIESNGARVLLRLSRGPTGIKRKSSEV